MSREELIEKMCEVDCNSRNEQQWQRFSGDRQAWREGMAEALDVAVGELLGEPLDSEYRDAYVSPVVRVQVHEFIGNRRSRYLKQPETLRDKVLGILRTNTVTTEQLADRIAALMEGK